MPTLTFIANREQWQRLAACRDQHPRTRVASLCLPLTFELETAGVPAIDLFGYLDGALYSGFLHGPGGFTIRHQCCV